jgi:hypothetical protein
LVVKDPRGVTSIGSLDVAAFATDPTESKVRPSGVLEVRSLPFVNKAY